MSAPPNGARSITADDARVELALDGVRSVMAGGFLAMANASREQTALLVEIRDSMKTLVELLKKGTS